MWIIAGIIALIGACVILFSRHRSKLANESGPQRQDRTLAKLKPFFIREIVETKVDSLFTKDERDDVLQLLDSDLPEGCGLERLQLAILKLSDGNLTSLRHYIAIARANYTDVIGPVEYPGALKIGLEQFVRLSNPEQEAITRRDLHRYLRWLKSR
jgi:hypothetical protein